MPCIILSPRPSVHKSMYLYDLTTSSTKCIHVYDLTFSFVITPTSFVSMTLLFITDSFLKANHIL
jgi:hypothetical protein